MTAAPLPDYATLADQARKAATRELRAYVRMTRDAERFERRGRLSEADQIYNLCRAAWLRRERMMQEFWMWRSHQ